MQWVSRVNSSGITQLHCNKKTSLNWCFSSSPNRKIVCNQTTSHALSINFLFVWHIRCASADRNSRVLISILKHKSMNQGLCILSQCRRNRGQFSPYPSPPTPDFGWNRSENCDMPIYVWRNNMYMIQSYKIKGLCMQDSVEELQRKINIFTEPKQNWLKQTIKKLATMSTSQIYFNVP